MIKVYTVRCDKPILSLLKCFKLSMLQEMAAEKSVIAWNHKGKRAIVSAWVIGTIAGILSNYEKLDNNVDRPKYLDQIAFNDQCQIPVSVAAALFFNESEEKPKDSSTTYTKK